ncbi:hypothetical protein BT67DRAFT_461622 [Trichocladium antarcticum]|uniref:Protein kinase domain-containing protein n=1 Tax=Trichocladium antarcticum TaxID=1450529 RepID=A0AAN6ZDP4_9PEZI|nr:hypothetical protein BT67DRAFT_461622 [Trichocladium antarcticum]
MAVPEDKRWPPLPPDVDRSAIEVETPELAITGNSMLLQTELGEYELQKAAGDCAIPVRGRVMLKSACDGDIHCMGFLMDLATPITVPTGPAPPLPLGLALPLSQRRSIMHQMIRLVQRLHAKGIDFAEGRYVDEDERSPNRLLTGERIGRDPAPPIFEDDLYGRGLSIWHLYTGKMPHGDMAGDDVGLKERQRKGETIDVAKVDDPEAREIIRGLLRQGGARI